MVGVAVLAPMLGWWVNQVLVDQLDPGTEDSRSAATGHDGHDDGALSAATTEDDPLRRCVTELATVERAVAAARLAVDHWTAHTRARTDMLRGRISVARMEAIYDRTRAEGPTDVARFVDAAARVDHLPPCRGLAAQDEPLRDKARDCLERARVAAAALAAARSTLGEWDDHLHHMDANADGGMTAGRALTLWIRAWREAPEGIERYEELSADLASAAPCGAP